MAKIKEFWVMKAVIQSRDRESTKLRYSFPAHPSGISFGVHVDTGMGGSADCKLVKGDASLGDASLILKAAVSSRLAVFKGACGIMIRIDRSIN